MLRAVIILKGQHHLIDAVDLILQLLTFSILSFLIIYHVCSVSLELNETVSELFVLISQSVQILLNEPLRL